ncbi:MAG: hypothetical protein IK015_02630 [Treponema sp.]|nr:hypothetical protein [Treponema sp.]
MKYFKANVKFGHVGRNNYYNGFLYLYANSKKDAARIAREYPRVKHDQKDAILGIEEINYVDFMRGLERNKVNSYFSCYNIQEQRSCFAEIQDSIFREAGVDDDLRGYKKKHSLRKVYNYDPEYDLYRHKKNIDCYVA